MSVVWAWLVISALGLGVSLYLARESSIDLNTVEGSNGRRLAAWSRLLREVLRASVHFAYILAGLGALDIIPWLRPFIVPILMYGNIVLLVNSLIDARTRHLLYDTRETDLQREDREAGDIRRAQ